MAIGTIGENDTNTTSSPTNTFGNLRFRHGSSARYDSDFKDQLQVCSEFVDEFPELDEIYTVKPKRESTITSNPDVQQSRSPQSSIAESIESTSASRRKTPGSSFSRPTVSSPVKRRRADDNEHASPVSTKQHQPMVVYPRRPAKSNRDIAEPESIFGVMAQTPVIPAVSTWDSCTFMSQELNIHDQMVDDLDQMKIQEACLLRYFVDELACWFDLCDPERHFALAVPHRAKHCPALLNAIYTASARHLCRLGQYRKNGCVEYQGKRLPNLQMETAVMYHSKCIEHLVSVSDDLEAVYDENLLVASVILRFYEEVDAPLSGGDWETAQKGTQVFITAQASTGLDGGLRRAAFRVAYRQEVYMAFVRQRPFLMPLNCHEYRSLEFTDDHSWAYRTIVHCADVLQYCYGDHNNNNSDYDMLVQYHEGWESLRPQSFDPIYEKSVTPNRRQILPEIWYLSDCHVTAHQHMDIAKILLTTYNPRIPRLGPSHRAAMQTIEAKVNAIVKRLCGVAISNHRSPPAMNTACMAISMCGEQIIDPEERASILEVLLYTEKKHAWPTKAIQDRLVEAWGGGRNLGIGMGMSGTVGVIAHGTGTGGAGMGMNGETSLGGDDDDLVTVDGWLL
ncbi:arca protein [Rutstroemia sp. NJR-2017a WRK4]|nr:arca protein [Rutstroemia sp. NJR-2017a WRK4]